LRYQGPRYLVETAAGGIVDGVTATRRVNKHLTKIKR
jgi:hypothetical protein